MDLIVKKTEETKPILVSLEAKKVKARPEIKVEKKELSENIRSFDSKPRVSNDNPFSYNNISLAKKDVPTLTASDSITSPTYNLIGKALGVDMVHDWDKFYDKVQFITNWAVEKSGNKDGQELAKWVYNQIKYVPSVTSKIVNDMYMFARLGTPHQEKKDKEKSQAVEVKKPITVDKSKDDTKIYVNNWIKKILGGQNVSRP